MTHARKRAGGRARRFRTDADRIDTRKPDLVHLSGDVTLERSLEIRKILLEAVAGKRNVLVDLSKVTYIDSAGIACLVEALQTARDHGADLGLHSVSAQAMRVIELARLDLVFPIVNPSRVERVH